jgi:hypothetical protein
MKESEVLLINLDTGEEIVADHDALLDRGMPDGYRTLDGMPKEELWKKIQVLLSR